MLVEETQDLFELTADCLILLCDPSRHLARMLSADLPQCSLSLMQVLVRQRQLGHQLAKSRECSPEVDPATQLALARPSLPVAGGSRPSAYQSARQVPLSNCGPQTQSRRRVVDHSGADRYRPTSTTQERDHRRYGCTARPTGIGGTPDCTLGPGSMAKGGSRASGQRPDQTPKRQEPPGSVPPLASEPVVRWYSWCNP